MPVTYILNYPEYEICGYLSDHACDRAKYYYVTNNLITYDRTVRLIYIIIICTVRVDNTIVSAVIL